MRNSTRTQASFVALAVAALTFALLLIDAASTPTNLYAQNAAKSGDDPFPRWHQRIADTHLDFTHYFDLQECYDTTRMFAERFPELCTYDVIGHSYEGRELLALTLTDSRTGRHDTKPAIYIDSNIHGTEIQGTEIIFLTIWNLLKKFEREPYFTHLAKTRTFYFVPVVNPDARHHWFAEAGNPGNVRHNFKPIDNDRDGQADEDPYNDLDGDGRILMMRKQDPDGDWVLGRDKRIMERRRPGEPGEYTMLGSEGIDDDGDGSINEDPPGGVDMNRNFPTAWLPEHGQRGAGHYPTSESEVRACVDFILARPNIAAFQFYHNTGRMILSSPGSSSDAGVISGGDRRVYDILGKRGQEYLPGYRYMQTHDELYAAMGTQIDFGFLGLGRFSFTNELWGETGVDLDGDGKFSREEIQRWYDNFGKGRGFIDWKPFTHPHFGEIELGGWDQFATRMSPSDMFMDEGYRNALFTLYQAEAIPELRFSNFNSEKLDVFDPENNLHRITFTLHNDSVMPTDSDKARERGTDNPVLVQVGGAQIVSCASGSSRELMVLQSGRHDALRIRSIGGESQVYCELVVRVGDGSLRLTASHPRCVDAFWLPR